MENEANNIRVQNEADLLLKYPQKAKMIFLAFEYRNTNSLIFKTYIYYKEKSTKCLWINAFSKQNKTK